MKKIIPFLVALLMLPSVHAQKAPAIEAAPLPDGPLLKRAPQFAKWTITYKYANEPDSGDTKPDMAGGSLDMAGGNSKEMGFGLPKICTVTKTGKVVHEVTTDTKHRKRERWSNGVMQVIEIPGSSEHIVEGMGGPFSMMSTNYNVSDFPGLDWITAKNYVGLMRAGEVNYIVFKRQSPEQMAYISLSNRLPVQLVSAEDRQIYAFDPNPPSQMQTFPESFQKDLDQRDELFKSVSKAPPKPF